MLADFTAWLLKLIAKLFTAVWDFVTDLFISILGTVLDAFTALIALIPIPGWLSGGLASTFGAMDPGIIYVVSQCGIPAALLIVGGGYAFRMLRKFFTLFQW
ncbi:hypothetical protein VLK31_35675 [Variovorax sp. H27-G14]|uniref:hypothetical protein n=1 Tax=Variovorax sp. H27-G14 TaxID=3111914 RepID=UPI0038FC7A0A